MTRNTFFYSLIDSSVPRLSQNDEQGKLFWEIMRRGRKAEKKQAEILG